MGRARLTSRRTKQSERRSYSASDTENIGDIEAVTAGDGLTGGGATGSVTLDVGAGTGITVAADTVSTNDAAIVHDDLSGFVPDEHIAHSGVSIVSGNGLTGGGAIDATKTIDVVNATNGGLQVNTDDIELDFTDLLVNTNIAADNPIPFHNVSAGAARSITFANFEGELDHDSLSGVVSDEHVLHAGVSVTAGLGLTGGGNISSTKTLDVGTGTGITVNANDVALNTAHSRNEDHDAINVIAGTGLTGGGLINQDRTLNVIGGTGITANANDIAHTSHTGDVTGATALTIASNAVTTTKIINDAVTYAKIQNVSATNRFLGRDTAGAGDVEEIAAGAARTILGSSTLGVGLSGTAPVGSGTINLDITGLTNMTLAPIGADEFLYNDNGTMKTMSYNQGAIPTNNDTNAHTFLDTDVGEARVYTGGTRTHAWTTNNGVGQIGCAILVVNNGTTAGPTLGAGTATVESSSGNFVVKQEGLVVMFQAATNVWKISGDLEA